MRFAIVVCDSSEIVEATVVIIITGVVEGVVEGGVLVTDGVVVTISEDEVVIKLGLIIVGIEEVVVVSVDDEVTTIELDTVVAALGLFVKTVLAAGVVCVNLSCSSIVLEVIIPVSSTEDVVDIGVPELVMVSEPCIPCVVIDCVVISSGITVFVSVVDCSVATTLLVVSGAKVVSFISSSGMDKSNP